MRYIEKKSIPQFFEQEKQSRNFDENTAWKRFGNPCKQALTQYIKHEQNDLCIYCECDLNSTSIHLEHLAPQETHFHLRFDYNNLTVSCDGFDCESQKFKQSCGHRKNNEYDEILFINPIKEKDINSYFAFIKDGDHEGAIVPALLSEDRMKRAAYMIKILRLDSEFLRLRRKAAKDALIDFVLNYPDLDIDSELSTYREYISFLRYYFAVN
jgi:uncharacterized protein (TIGR02646 family)